MTEGGASLALTFAAAALVFWRAPRQPSPRQDGGSAGRALPDISDDRLASAERHQIDVTFPPGTGRARMEEALADGALRLQAFDDHDGARFVTVTYSTVSGRTEAGAILRHAWGVTLDTDREVAYVFDSKYERDAHAVLAHLAAELPEHLDVRRYAVHDLTVQDGQVEGTCTRWTVALNALIVAGVIDESVDKRRVFSALTDGVVGAALAAVGFDVSTDGSFRTLVAILGAALSTPRAAAAGSPGASTHP